MTAVLAASIIAASALVRLANAQDSEEGENDVAVTLMQEQPVEAALGQPLTLPISVQPKAAGRYTESIGLPSGWRAITNDRTFSLGPGSSDTRLVTLSIPRGTTAGSYQVVYSVRDNEGSTVGEKLSIGVTVPERRAARLRVAESPSFTTAGDTLTVALEVRNTGNVGGSMSLQARASSGRLVEKNLTVRIGPRAVSRAEIRSIIPSDLQNRTTHRLQIAVRLDGEKLDSTRLSTPIFPPPSGRGGKKYHRYPLTVNALASGTRGTGEDGLGYQFDISGSGTLREESPTEYSFDVRAPRADGSGFFLRRRNEFSAAVSHPNFRVALGDQSVRLSDLTRAQGRFGGVARAEARGYGAQIYAARSRFGANSRHAGARLDARWGGDDGNEVGLNGVLREGRIEGRMLSMDASLSPLKNVDVDVEHGISGGADGGGSATEASGEARFENVSVGGRYARVGESYPRFGTSRRFYAGFFSLSPPFLLSLRGRFSASQFGARDRTRAQLDLGVMDWLTIGYEQNRVQEESSFRGSTDARRDAFRLQASIGNGPLRVQGTAELGRLTSFGSSQPQYGQRYRGRISSSPLRWLGVRLRGEYRNGVSLLSQRRRNELSARLGLNSSFDSGTDANLGLEVRRRSAGVLSQEQLQVQGRARLSHEFEPKGHVITVAGRFSNGAFGFLKSGLSVRYSIPVGVPIHRSQKTGMVKGKLVDKSSGEGIARVPVRLGERGAITGPRGTFSISRVEPGRYSFTLNQQSLEPNKRIEQIPSSVLVKGGTTEKLRLEAVEVGAVTGRVRIERREGLAVDSGRVEGLSGALVELDTGQSTRRQFTGKDGTFRFLNVAPKVYTVRLLSRSLPNQTNTEKGEKKVEVVRGDTTETTFMVRPRERNMKLLAPNEGQGEVSEAQSEAQSEPEASDVEKPSGEASEERKASAKGRDPAADGRDPAELFKVQLGAFVEWSNAEFLAQKVLRDGHPVTIQTERQDGQFIFKVQAGSYNSRSEAEGALSQFSQYSPNVFVVPLEDSSPKNR